MPYARHPSDARDHGTFTWVTSPIMTTSALRASLSDLLSPRSPRSALGLGVPDALPGGGPARDTDRDTDPDASGTVRQGGLVLHIPCRPPGPAVDALEDNLRRSGWRVRSVPGHSLSDEAARDQVPDVVLLSGEAEHADAVIALLRRLDGLTLPALRIVQLGNASAFLRIQALHAGADLCFAPDVSAEWAAAELIAIFERRRRNPAGGGPRRWRICGSSRYLFGPGAVQIPLTAAEGLFLGRLLAAPNQRLPRAGGSRGDDVTVARLRSKARQLGVDLPVCAVRRWGYLFLDEV